MKPTMIHSESRNKNKQLMTVETRSIQASKYEVSSQGQTPLTGHSPKIKPHKDYKDLLADCDEGINAAQTLVKDHLAEIDKEIAGINDKVNSMVQSHEKDFLISYKGHMHRVNKELDKYKRQLTENEFLMRRDKLVVKLESSLEWFKKEALDL